jgi:hypothetical protein
METVSAFGVKAGRTASQSVAVILGKALEMPNASAAAGALLQDGGLARINPAQAVVIRQIPPNFVVIRGNSC